MSYTTKVTLTAPLGLSDICAAIARGMDTDVGGAASFRPIYPSASADKSADGYPEKPLLPATHLEAAFWAVPEFATAIKHLMADPNALHATLALDYSLRWLKLIPPTIEECQLFCQRVSLSLVYPQKETI
ncbi:MAG: hypothetical protein NT086_01940 [Proteobacteria bacterium]|nr:hypothetical protein [Pseudomonadota bacterium]